MEFRDPVHGPIYIHPEEVKIVAHPFFQRLRNIKQLGLSEYSFPGATHTRFLHSLGVSHIVTRAFEKLFANLPTSAERQKLKFTTRLAGLLHDIGHAPLSHSSEYQMPQVDLLNLAGQSHRQATHEDYTVKAITDSSLYDSFKEITDKYGVEAKAISDLIQGENTNPDYFIFNNTNYFPLLHQLISSEMDCDRMDYLLRDSYFCGVSYGHFDLDWMIDNLKISVNENNAYLAIDQKAISTFDDFLIGRYHMFIMVYFHYRATCLEKLLYKYFDSSPDEYKIPANIEEYQKHDDHYLMKILRSSNNAYAKKIVTNSIPPKFYETFSHQNIQPTKDLRNYLDSEGIDYLFSSSRGRLSKYNYVRQEIKKEKNHYPIKVIQKRPPPLKSLTLNIQQATDLFSKYSKEHNISRIHLDFNNLSNHHQKQILELIESRDNNSQN